MAAAEETAALAGLILFLGLGLFEYGEAKATSKRMAATTKSAATIAASEQTPTTRPTDAQLADIGNSARGIMGTGFKVTLSHIKNFGPSIGNAVDWSKGDFPIAGRVTLPNGVSAPVIRVDTQLSYSPLLPVRWFFTKFNFQKTVFVPSP